MADLASRPERFCAEALSASQPVSHQGVPFFRLDSRGIFKTGAYSEHARTELQDSCRNHCFADRELRPRAELRPTGISESYAAAGAARHGPGAPHDRGRKGDAVNEPVARDRAVTHIGLQLVE